MFNSKPLTRIHIAVNNSGGVRDKVYSVVSDIVKSLGIGKTISVKEDRHHNFITIESNTDDRELPDDLSHQVRLAVVGKFRGADLREIRELPSIESENGRSAHGLQRRLEALQSQLAEAHETSGVYMAQVSQLEAENNSLKKRVQGSAVQRRGDLHVQETIRLGRQAELRSLSERYSAALHGTSFDLKGETDLGQQILNAARGTESKFEESETYEGIRRDYEEAQAALEAAQNQSRFFKVNTDLAQEVIDRVNRMKERHGNQAQEVEKLREILSGNSVIYLITTDKDEVHHKISVTLPIESRESTADFSELETDLISHVHDQWSRVRNTLPGTFERTDRDGLVEYTFKVPKGKVTPLELKAAEERLKNYLFESQSEYSFGALGLRVDVELVGNTSGLELKVQESTQVTQTPQPPEITQTVRGPERPEGIVSGSFSENANIYYRLARNVFPKLEMQNINVLNKTSSELTAATIYILSLSDRPLNIGEIKERINKIHPEYDFNDRNLTGLLSQAIGLRVRKGLLVKSGPQRTMTYDIAPEFKK